MKRPSLFEIVFARLTKPERWVEMFRRLEPSLIPEIAVDRLRRQGVVLVGDPTLVAYAKRCAERQIELEIEDWQKQDETRQRSPGRPTVSPISDLIVMSAIMKFSKECSHAQACKMTVAYLGSPMTLSRVQKARRRFLSSPYLHHGLHFHTRCIAANHMLFEECERELTALKRPSSRRA